jgi:hypothetical protein
VTDKRHSVSEGDEFKYQGKMRRVAKIVSICVELDGVEDVVCLPVAATRIETFDPPEAELVCQHCGVGGRPGRPVEDFLIKNEIVYLLHPDCAGALGMSTYRHNS